MTRRYSEAARQPVHAQHIPGRVPGVFADNERACPKEQGAVLEG